MKSFALFPLVVTAVAAMDVGTFFGWPGAGNAPGTVAPAPSPVPESDSDSWTFPPSRPYSRPASTPINIIAPPTPAVPVPIPANFPGADLYPTSTRAAPAPAEPTNPAPAPTAYAPAPPAPSATTTSTPAPSPTPSAAPSAQSTNTTPAPTAYVPPPIPTASADSTTFQLIEPVVCDENVVNTIQKIYSKNRKLFDTCAQDSAYQIFPYSGKPPTATQIQALATSKSCTILFTACVNANLPDCEVTGMSARSAVDTLLKITMDLQRGRASPDTERFSNMYIWRRNSNLAKAAGVPYGNDSALYAEYDRDLADDVAEYSVQVQDDLNIVYNERNDESSGRSAAVMTIKKIESGARSQHAVVASLGVVVLTLAALVA